MLDFVTAVFVSMSKSGPGRIRGGGSRPTGPTPLGYGPDLFYLQQATPPV